MTIPDWNIHGVLPPIRPGQEPVSRDRAPYRASLCEVCVRFGATRERRAILLGLIDLRARLRAIGLAPGFQWLDGSFAEHVEQLEGRPPRDVDVVTFVALGDRGRQRGLLQVDPELFDGEHVKDALHVDHYLFPTDRALDAEQAKWLGYWYSMWSHRRDDRWKGFVEVALDRDPADDDLAREWLVAQDVSTDDDGARDEP